MLRLNRESVLQLLRFYQAAIINTAFGYGAYAILLACGINLFVAQAMAFAAGTAFNYLTYSRHVFRSDQPAKMRFAAAYLLNYVVNVSALALVGRVIHNGYVAGAAAIVIASLVNYFVLRSFVFVDRSA